MNIEQERLYWLAWSRVKGVGPLLVQRLVQKFQLLSIAWQASIPEIITVEGVGPKVCEAIAAQRPKLNPQALLDDLERQQIQFWTPVDHNYPRLLKEIPSMPPILYYRGHLDEAEAQGDIPAVGIVGTRNASDYGRRWTHRISTTLAQHGFTIVSGMAAGIDTVAHRACLQVGGRTIAVLGTGVDVVYPRSNQRLYEQIVEQGLVISDYPPGTKPTGHNFPPRNRIIAGLSRATLVMEAAQRSGALITARYANEFNRDVYTLPGSLDNPQALGCLALGNQGAQFILSDRQLLESLGEIPQLDPVGNPDPPPELDEPLRTIWRVIAREGTPFDRIVQQSGYPAPTVSSALTQLELLGLITHLPGSHYRQGSSA